MAYTAYRTWVVGAVLTAAQLNTDLRDNGLLTAPAILTTRGDTLYANAANTPTRLPIGTAGQVYKVNSGATAPEWGVGSMITAEPFEWNRKAAQRYIFMVRGDQLLNNAVLGDLLDADWVNNAATIKSDDTARAADLDSQSDATGHDRLAVANVGGRYFASPYVIGEYTLLEALKAITGTRPTTITVWFVAAFEGVVDAADTAGFGIRGGATTGAWGTTDYAIMVGGTNFEMWDGSAATDLSVAKDAVPHLWEFVIDIAGGTFDLKIDGTVRLNDEAADTDEWPKACGIYHGGTGQDIYMFGWGVNYD